MDGKCYQTSMDDWTVADVWNNSWTYSEVRNAVTDLLFGPLDFCFECKTNPSTSAPTTGSRSLEENASKATSQPRRFENIRNLTTALTKSLKPQPMYNQPQPSLVALQAFDLTSDQDFWVERYHFDESNQRISYFRSFKTGKCILSEPPSGAHAILFRRDLDTAPVALQMFAQEPLDHRSSKDLAKQVKRAHKKSKKT